MPFSSISKPPKTARITTACSPTPQTTPTCRKSKAVTGAAGPGQNVLRISRSSTGLTRAYLSAFQIPCEISAKCQETSVEIPEPRAHRPACPPPSCERRPGAATKPPSGAPEAAGQRWSNTKPKASAPGPAEARSRAATRHRRSGHARVPRGLGTKPSLRRSQGSWRRPGGASLAARACQRPGPLRRAAKGAHTAWRPAASDAWLPSGAAWTLGGTGARGSHNIDICTHQRQMPQSCRTILLWSRRALAAAFKPQVGRGLRQQQPLALQARKQAAHGCLGRAARRT